MDLPLNGTLLVQALNFFIVYTILEHLFFKPILAQIRTEEQEHAVLVAHAEDARNQLATLQNHIVTHWHKCREYLHSLLPALFSLKVPTLTSSSFQVSTPDKKDIHEVVTLLRRRLEKPC